MGTTNPYEPGQEENQDHSGDDPFLKRIQMQGKIIRKMLTQVDSPEDSFINHQPVGQKETDSEDIKI